MPQTLAVKYRPQVWGDLIGQFVVTHILSQMIVNEDLRPFMIFGGPRGTGKCVSGDVLVWTKEGLKEIGQIISDPEEGFNYESHSVLLGGDWVDSKSFYFQSQTEIMELRTHSGRDFGATPNHKIVSFRDGYHSWNEVRTLVEGDFIPVFLDISPIIGDPSVEMEVFGFLIGDASYTKGRRILISLAESDREWLESRIDLSTSKRWKDKRSRLGLEIVDLQGEWRRRFWSCKFENADAYTKDFPIEVTSGSRAELASLMRGLWRADGYCGSTIEITLASLFLIKKSQEILRRLGIFSRITEKIVSYEGEDRLFFRLSVTGHENIQRFRTVIGWKGDRIGVGGFFRKPKINERCISGH